MLIDNIYIYAFGTYILFKYNLTYSALQFTFFYILCIF